MTAPTLPTRSLRDPMRGMLAAASSPWLLGVLGAVWAGVIGLGLALIPMVILWVGSPDPGLGWLAWIQLGGLLWVVAHGAPLTLAGVGYSLLPWGLTLVPLLLLGCGGSWAARRAVARSGDATLRNLVPIVAAGSVAYAALVGLASAGTSGGQATTAVLGAVVHGLVLALLGMGFGALRGAGVDPWTLAPRELSTTVRAGLVGALALVGLGAVAGAVSLLSHLDDAVTMMQSLGGGWGGGLGLAALAVGYVPVAAMWASAYVMGAGVVIGSDVTVSPFLTVTAPVDLPPFPLLALVPSGAPALAWLLPVAGVAAGILAGIVIGRRARGEPRLLRLAMAAGAALVAGALLSVGAWLSSGSLGVGRLAFLGPTPLTVGVLGAVLVVMGAAPSAVAPAASARRRVSPVPVPPSLDPEVSHD